MFRLLAALFGRSSSCSQRRYRPQLEALEPRNQPSGTPYHIFAEPSADDPDLEDIHIASVIDGQVYPTQVSVSIVGGDDYLDEEVVIEISYQGQTMTESFACYNALGEYRIGTIYFLGRPGDDEFHNNTPLACWVQAGEGNDSLFGGSNNDFLMGWEGNDFIYGGWGNDYIRGDAGDDWLYGEQGDDHIIGHAGIDWLFGQDGLDWLEGRDDMDFLFGGANDDTLEGGLGEDTLSGGQDNDDLYGGFLDYCPNDDTSADSLAGDGGNDWLWGGQGNDYLAGGSGNDYLLGEAGNDELHGEGGADHLYGGSDYINSKFDDGQDKLFGGDDNDYLYGGTNNDDLDGGAGGDYVDGQDGDDELFCADDGVEDYLYGGSGADTFHIDRNDVIADFNTRHGDEIVYG